MDPLLHWWAAVNLQRTPEPHPNTQVVDLVCCTIVSVVSANLDIEITHHDDNVMSWAALDDAQQSVLELLFVLLLADIHRHHCMMSMLRLLFSV